MDFLRNKNLIKLVGHFEKMGYQIRVVGGAVRDALQKLPCKDIDLCTDADPNEMMELAEKFSLHVVPTGLQHGTVTFVINGEPFEVTTLRVDVETDGRHAQVEYTRSFTKDAFRRDLTINAMSMDMNGNVYDYFCGREDLRKNRVRFVGEARDRVREDYLRVLRWFRFAARMKQFPEYRTIESELRLFGEADTLNGLANISGERIWSELKKILVAPNGRKAIEYMMSTHVFNSISTDKAKFRSQGIGAFSVQILIEAYNAQNDYSDDFADMKEAMVMASLAVLVGVHQADQVIERLKFSTKERKYFEFMVRWIELAVFQKKSLGQLESWFYFRTSEGADPQLLMAAVKIAEINARMDGSILKNIMTDDGKVKFSQDQAPFPVSGKDLAERGVRPGPAMGHLLKAMRLDWALQPHPAVATKKMLLDNVLGQFSDPSEIYAMKVPVVKVDEFFQDHLDYMVHHDMTGETVKVLNLMQDLFEAESEFHYVDFDMDPDGDQHFLAFFKSKDSAMIAKLREGAFASAR